MKKINAMLFLRLFISAAVAIIMLAVMGPAGEWLNDLGDEPLIDWRIPFNTNIYLKGDTERRGFFASGKEDAAGNTVCIPKSADAA